MQKKRNKYKLFFILILIINLLLLAFACNNNPESIEENTIHPTIPEVGYIEIKPQTHTEIIKSFGVIEADEEIMISLDFSERVIKIMFEEGQKVKAGQLLILLDSKKQKLRIHQCKTELNQTKAILENAQKNYKRNESLFLNGNIPRVKYEDSQLQLKTAKAHYEEAQTTLQLSKRELDDRKVYSPVNGTIEKKMINVGEMTTPGAGLAVIQADNALRVSTFVTEKEINHLKLGEDAEVRSTGVTGKVYMARIDSLGAKGDPYTGNFPVKLTISNNDERLRPGMTAQVSMKGLTKEDAILIPDTALVDMNRRQVAFKIVDDKAIEVQPVFSLSYHDKVHILSGLDAGDRLIVEGLQNIVKNIKVKPFKIN